MKIVFAESDFWNKNDNFTKKYEKLISESFKKAKDLLPSLPPSITFVCQTNDWECVSETGEGGFTRSSRLILLTFDPKLPYGEDELLQNIEATVLHELNHSARYEIGIMHESFMDNCVMEGVASVFEREYSKRGEPLWAKYDDSNIVDWYREIVLATKSPFSWREYMYRHTDGRRWMGYKIGTWIVDEAMKNGGKTIVDLTILENKEIIKLAQIS